MVINATILLGSFSTSAIAVCLDSAGERSCTGPLIIPSSGFTLGGTVRPDQPSGIHTLVLDGSAGPVQVQSAGGGPVQMLRGAGWAFDTSFESIGEVSITSTSGSSSRGIRIFHRDGAEQNISIVTSDRTQVKTTGGGSSNHGVYGFYDNQNVGVGNVSINNRAGVTTAGSNSYGIFALNYGLGDSVVVNRGEILTDGESSHGIQVRHQGEAGNGALISVEHSSNIKTNGREAVGIYGFVNNQNSNADIAIQTNSGSIITTGNQDSFGVYALNQGLGSTNVELSGDIVTSGIGAHGVYADTTNANNDENITVNMMDGSIKTMGDTAIGALVMNAGSGLASTIITGGSVETMGNDANGVFANARGAGDALVQVSGDATVITTMGANSSGAYALSTGTGNADAQMDGGTIETAGDSASGLSAAVDNINSARSASATMTAGDITTMGGFSHGIIAETVGLGSVQAQMDGGTISTGGERGRGVLAFINDNTASTATATAIITGGEIETQGESASGLEAQTEGLGDATTIMSGGMLTVNGVNATGISSFVNNTASLATSSALLASGDVIANGNRVAGLFAENRGNGLTLAQMDGGTILTTGTSTVGMGVFGATTGNTTTVNSVFTDGTITTTGESAHGIRLFNRGSSLTAARMDGGTIDAQGLNADGIFAEATAGIVDIDINDGSITSGSGLAAGIRTTSVNGSTIDIAVSATVDGAASGIAIRDGDANRDGIDENGGNVIVTTAGTITGDAILGLGDDTFNLTDGIYTGNIYGDDKTASVDDGNDTFNWTGGQLDIGFNGGDGSDIATISATSGYDGTQIMDGGDDVSAADGFTDTLTVNGKTITTAGANLINWENINIDGGELTISDGALTVGSEPNTGLTLMGGTLKSSLAALNITGNLNNNGIVDMQNSAAGDSIAVSGDYAGTGELLVDVDFASDTSDTLDVAGDIIGGSTLVRVQDVTAGGPTGNDITIVNFGGTSNPGDFVLAGPVVNGVFNYDTLAQDGQTWELQSGGYTPIASAVEGLGRSLLTLESLPTLNQRQSIQNDRERLSHPAPAGTEPAANRSVWMRIVGGEQEQDSNRSTTGADFDTELWRVQAGANRQIMNNDKGRFVLGLNGSYSEGDTNVSALAGRSSIDTEGLSVGVTGTWYAPTDSGYDGLYVDTQAQRSSYVSDISGSAVRGATNNEGADHIENIDSDGLSFSVEMGQRIALESENDLSVTPQAQLVYSKVDFDGFTGRNNVVVESDEAKSLQARVGLTVDTQIRHQAGSTTQGYLLANVLHEFEDGSAAIVSGARLSNDIDRWRGEIGGGVSHVWETNSTTSYEVFGEVLGSTSLNNVGDSNGVQGTVGFRVLF